MPAQTSEDAPERDQRLREQAELQRLRERLALTPAERWERFVASMRSLEGFRGIARRPGPTRR